MPILSIKGASAPIVTVACAACTENRDVTVEGLRLGTETDPHIVALPVCPCGAQEFLVRTTDVHPDESRAGHRKKVNALAEHLRAKSRIHLKHTNVIKHMITPAQIGELLGEVAETSLPENVVGPRRKARALNEAAAAAKATVTTAPAPTSPTDPMMAVLSMFAMAQDAFKKVQGMTSASAPEPKAEPAP